MIQLSLKFLPLPIYLIICLFISSFLILTAIKRYYKDRIGLIGLYITVAFLPLLAAISRFIDGVYQQFSKIIDYISVAAIAIFVTMFIQLIYLALTHKGDEKSKMLINVGFIVIVVSAIPALVLLIIE